EECRRRNGENPDPGIRDKRLGCRALRQLRRRCARPPAEGEIRQTLASEGQITARPLPQPSSIEWSGWPQAGKVTARQEPRPTGWAAVGRLGGGDPLPVQISHSERFDIPHGQKELARCLS